MLIQGAVFLKFDGVDGESKDKDHKGWIDLSSVSTRSSDHKKWSDLQSFSQGLAQDNAGKGQGIVHRDVATRNVDTRRDAASGLATGKREAASGQASGRRDAASGMATGKRQHEPIRITKRIDKATPLLAKALSSGQPMGTVTIQKVADGKTETMILQNATVAAVSKEGPREHVTFNYEKVQVRGWNPKEKKAIVGKANRASVGAKEKANRTK